MDLTTQNHFVNLGKALAEKEHQEKNFTENQLKLKEDFQELEELSFEVKDNFYSVYNNIADFLEKSENEKDINALVFYLLIKNEIIQKQKDEIKSLNDTYELSNDQNESYIKEIETLEGRIKRGKEIVQRKNTEIESFTQEIRRNNFWFLWLYVFLFSSVSFNFIFLIFWNNDTFYTTFLKIMVILLFQYLLRINYKFIYKLT
jgi:hypothetical protein